MKHGFKVSNAFKDVLVVAAGITVLSGLGCLVMANQNNPSSQQIRVFESFNTTWNMGVGAIFGLLGSRSVGTSRKEGS